MNFDSLITRLDQLRDRLAHDRTFAAAVTAGLGGALLMSGVSPILPSWARLVLALLLIAALLSVLQIRAAR